MDFQNLNGFWKSKSYCRTIIELIDKLVDFISSLNFPIILIFSNAKCIFKTSVLKFCLLEIIV